MSREEHLAWCKARALEYVEAGDVEQAFSSFVSDMGKHADTANHVGLSLMHKCFLSGLISSPASMGRFIEGFN
jgi:hypothetical protein